MICFGCCLFDTNPSPTPMLTHRHWNGSVKMLQPFSWQTQPSGYGCWKGALLLHRVWILSIHTELMAWPQLIRYYHANFIRLHDFVESPSVFNWQRVRQYERQSNASLRFMLTHATQFPLSRVPLKSSTILKRANSQLCRLRKQIGEMKNILKVNNELERRSSLVYFHSCR